MRVNFRGKQYFIENNIPYFGIGSKMTPFVNLKMGSKMPPGHTTGPGTYENKIMFLKIGIGDQRYWYCIDAKHQYFNFCNSSR